MQPALTEPPAESVVRAYFVCLDSEDWTGMRELWWPDAQLRAVGTKPRLGREEVIAYFSRLFVPWPQHEDRPTRLICDANTVVAEVTFTGTTPTGRRVAFDAVDVFDVEAGRIRRFSNWYDIAYARKVLAEAGTGG